VSLALLDAGIDCHSFLVAVCLGYSRDGTFLLFDPSRQETENMKSVVTIGHASGGGTENLDLVYCETNGIFSRDALDHLFKHSKVATNAISHHLKEHFRRALGALPSVNFAGGKYRMRELNFMESEAAEKDALKDVLKDDDGDVEM